MDRAPRKSDRGKTLVAEALATRVLSGVYPPGRPLPNEATLLSEFGVSRTCLREALQMLSAKGLVRSRPKLGTFVREPQDWNFLDVDILRLRQRVLPKAVFLKELFAVRRMVEPETAALAAVNATPALLAKMQVAVLEMGRGGDNVRAPHVIEADVAFHRLLLTASGNALLSGLGACIEEALRASIDITSHPDVGSRFALDKHLAVFEAVCDGNAGAARKNMHALLDMTEEVLERAGYGAAIRQETVES
jgi:DNA-binding FadR family transcriptional regulator